MFASYHFVSVDSIGGSTSPYAPAAASSHSAKAQKSSTKQQSRGIDAQIAKGNKVEGKGIISELFEVGHNSSNHDRELRDVTLSVYEDDRMLFMGRVETSSDSCWVATDDCVRRHILFFLLAYPHA
jgi:hypothetical protein